MVAAPITAVVVVDHVVHAPLPKTVKVKTRLRELKVSVFSGVCVYLSCVAQEKVKVNKWIVVVLGGHLVTEEDGGAIAEDLQEGMKTMVVTHLKR